MYNSTQIRINNILEHHREYISTISVTYEEDRDRLLEMSKKDKETVDANVLDEETYMKTIIYGQECESAELAKNAQKKYDDDKIEELTSVSLPSSILLLLNTFTNM